jgi:hypothetical protein
MKLIAILAVLPLAACADPPAVDEDEGAVDLTAQSGNLGRRTIADLAAAAVSTARYLDIANAEADGYVNSGLPCIDGQGFHFINNALVGTNDVRHPQLLVYQPRANGSLRLVSLEWLTPVDATNQNNPPVLFGQTFHGPNMIDGVPFPFFALHVWLWQLNPDGLFEDTTPRFSCP